jgi:hypothetical protein
LHDGFITSFLIVRPRTQQCTISTSIHLEPIRILFIKSFNPITATKHLGWDTHGRFLTNSFLSLARFIRSDCCQATTRKIEPTICLVPNTFVAVTTFPRNSKTSLFLPGCALAPPENPSSRKTRRENFLIDMTNLSAEKHSRVLSMQVYLI